MRGSFLSFLLNGYHQEWLGSTTTNHHGVAAFDLATLSGCDLLVNGFTHARGGALDIQMTDISVLVWVAVVALIGIADHSSRRRLFRWLRLFQTCVLVRKLS